nr:odorant-binding protein 6 [Plautia stali]
MTRYVSVISVTMDRLMAAKSLSLLCAACLVIVAYGGVIIDECTSVQEKAAPLCCRGDIKKDEKEEEMEKNMKLCLTQYMADLSRTPRGEERTLLLECVGECVFKYSKLLTPDLKLKKELIMNMEDMIDEDPKWKEIEKTAVDTCMDRIEGEISESSTCKSGSYQLVRCMARETFLNCPKDSWTESDECTEYKNVVLRCPGLIPYIYE